MKYELELNSFRLFGIKITFPLLKQVTVAIVSVIGA